MKHPRNPFFCIPSAYVVLFWAGFAFTTSCLGIFYNRYGLTSPESYFSCEFRVTQLYNSGEKPAPLIIPGFYYVFLEINPYWHAANLLFSVLAIFSILTFKPSYWVIAFALIRILDLCLNILGDSILIAEFPKNRDITIVGLVFSTIVKVIVLAAIMDYIFKYDFDTLRSVMELQVQFDHHHNTDNDDQANDNDDQANDNDDQANDNDDQANDNDSKDENDEANPDKTENDQLEAKKSK